MPMKLHKGRGAISNADGRYESTTHVSEDDGWGVLDDELLPLKTTVTNEAARTIISRNDIPRYSI